MTSREQDEKCRNAVHEMVLAAGQLKELQDRRNRTITEIESKTKELNGLAEKAASNSGIGRFHPQVVVPTEDGIALMTDVSADHDHRLVEVKLLDRDGRTVVFQTNTELR